MAKAEKIFTDVLVNKLSTESTIQADIGSAVYLGLTLKTKDLPKYMPCLNINTLAYGKGNLYAGDVFQDFVVIESVHETDLSQSSSTYDKVRKYLLKNNQLKGNTFKLNIYEQSPPQQLTGWDDKAFITKGTWKIIWKRV